MDLMQEKIEGLLEEQSILNRFGVRVHFGGDLKHLTAPVRSGAERVMAATAGNSGFVLGICVGYTSTDEMAHTVHACCEEKRDPHRVNETEGSLYEDERKGAATAVAADVEKHMYMAVMPEVNILVRTSGETRLSNFLLWQTENGLLYSPSALWPEIGFWHLVWAVLNFQRHFDYWEKRKKTLQVSQVKKEL